MSPQTDITKSPIVLKRDEADIRAARGGLVGLVACRDLRPTTAMTLPPNGTVTEGRFSDQTFASAPSIETVQTGNGSIPGSDRDALPGHSAATNPMIGDDVVTVSLPYRLPAGFREKTNPDQDVITIGAERVFGANTVQWEVQEELIKIGIVKLAVSKDHRNVRIKPVRWPAFLNSDA
jgi:hypothetical protein